MLSRRSSQSEGGLAFAVLPGKPFYEDRRAGARMGEGGLAAASFGSASHQIEIKIKKNGPSPGRFLTRR